MTRGRLAIINKDSVYTSNECIMRDMENLQLNILEQ